MCTETELCGRKAGKVGIFCVILATCLASYAWKKEYLFRKRLTSYNFLEVRIYIYCKQFLYSIIFNSVESVEIYNPPHVLEIKGCWQTDGRMDRRSDGQTDRQTNRQQSKWFYRSFFEVSLKYMNRETWFFEIYCT